MPPNERLRLHNGQEPTPVDEPRQYNERNPGRVIGPAGLTCRSRYNANCFRRNRFSATSCACGRHVDATNRWTSLATRRIVQTTTWERDWVMPQDGTPRTLVAVDPLYIDVQHDRIRRRFPQFGPRFSRIEFLRTTAVSAENVA